MAYVSQLRFGPNVHIEMTRDAQRRICKLTTILKNKEEGYLLETDGEHQSGRLFILPSRIVHEEYRAGVVSFPRQGEDEQRVIDYEAWINSCIQQATAWARSYAIQEANDSIGEGEFTEASQTYHDVIDHFPPPPDGPLLHWNYYRCIAQMEGIEAAKEGLLLWLYEAIPIAGVNVTNAILEPAKELLGEEEAKEVAKQWIASSSPHDPAHKMTKRWLDRLAHGGALSLSWESAQTNPLQTIQPLLIPMQNGDVMVVGGQDETGKPSSKAAIWHVTTKEWTTISELPIPLRNHSGLAINRGSVMVVGGKTGEKSFSNRVFLWSFAQDAWQELPSLSLGRELCGMEVMDNGLVVVMGGEDPLLAKTCMEFWDRRKESWSQRPMSSVYYSELTLQSFQDKVLLMGSGVSTSGFGALLYDIDAKKWIYCDALRGVGLDGAVPINSDECVVWRKKTTEIDIGIWSYKNDKIHWGCKDIEIGSRVDLSMVYHYEESKCILVFTDGEGKIQAQLINSKTGALGDLMNVGALNLEGQEIVQCSLLDGVFILDKAGWAKL